MITSHMVTCLIPIYVQKKNAGWFDTCWLVPAALTVLEEYYCINCSCIFSINDLLIHMKNLSQIVKIIFFRKTAVTVSSCISFS